MKREMETASKSPETAAAAGARRPGRLRVVAIGGSGVAAAAALLAGLGKCHGCSLMSQWMWLVALAACLGWTLLCFWLALGCRSVTKIPSRWAAGGAVVMASVHLTIFMERPAAACGFCATALVAGLACSASLIMARGPRDLRALAAIGLAGLLMGTWAAPLVVKPAVTALIEGNEELKYLRPAQLPAIVSILSPRCPVCHEFLKAAVPVLKQRFGNDFDVFWILDPDDTEAFDYVQALSPGVSREEILAKIAGAVEILERTGVREVPVTILGGSGSEPEVILGPATPEEIEGAARRVRAVEIGG